MKGYLGEVTLKSLKDTPFDGFNPSDWAIEFISRYGGIDGAHHKAWVLDQVARILHLTPVVVRLAKWNNGHEEYRISTGKPSRAYLDWVEEMKGEVNEDGESEYSYDEGIAP